MTDPIARIVVPDPAISSTRPATADRAPVMAALVVSLMWGLLVGIAIGAVAC